jgi:GT2 family glycosyltransferase
LEAPKISIIVLNYNGWTDTIECIESVRRNRYPDYRLIVVDNGSTDGSMDYLKLWAAGRLDVWVDPVNPLRRISYPPVEKPMPYVCGSREEEDGIGGDEGCKGEADDSVAGREPIVLIQTGRNLGFAGGNNVGIRYAMKAGTDYVLLLNNDTVVEPGFLVELARTAARPGRVGIVGGRILHYDNPERIWYAGGKMDLLRGSGYHFRTGKAAEEFPVSFVTGCLMLISAEVIRRVGLPAEEYFLTGEDLDYCYRCREAGFELWANPKAVVYHRISSAMCRVDSSAEVYYNSRNRIHFMLHRVRRLWYVVVFCVFFLASRILKALGFLLTGRMRHLAALCKGTRDGMCIKARGRVRDDGTRRQEAGLP